MSYVANIPQSTDLPSVSQGQVLGNFQAINSWVQVDHVGFNLADAGQHNQVTLVLQGSAPSFAAQQGGIFNTSSGTNSGVQEIWFNQPSTGLQYPITDSILSTVATPANFANGYARLPSGILLKWGKATGIVNGANAIVLTTSASAGPALNASLTCQLTFQAAGGGTATVTINSFIPGTQTLNVTCANISGTPSLIYFFVGY